MFQRIIRFIGGDPHKRELNRLTEIIDEINELEPQYEALSDEALRGKTVEFRQRLDQGETLDDLLPEAFAAVREASKRTIGLRPYDVQLIGGIAMHEGKIAEMRTGEGKTLVATLPLYLNALPAKGVHLVTVNDYLARRDARWMGAIYRMLGLEVGVLQMAARTENGRNAFLFDPERKSPHEDQDQLRTVHRKEAYQADITYGTNSEFGFDYLRDNLTMSLAERVQRGHRYAIVDEVDNILIDEARTPLIISGPASEDTEWSAKMALIVRQLNPEDYEIAEKDQTVSLTEIGEAHVEQILDIPLRDPERPEDVTPEQARLIGYLEQALRAQFLYRRNKEYLVQAGKVIIVDEFTGRLMPGRRWSDGLHQAVEAKEGVKIEPENITYATITLQNYFRMYEKLSGMTGTALTESEEFYKIYKLDVLPIPTNLEFQAFRDNSPLLEINTKDEKGYKYAYFARRNDTSKQPAFWRRKDYPDVVYRSEEAKLRAIALEIVINYIKGRPQLVGTTSVEHSDRLSDRLRPEPLRRMFQAMLIRQAWMEKNNRQDEERAIPELQPLYRPLDQLSPPELRQMARTVGMASINPEDEANLPRLSGLLGLAPEDNDRLLSMLQAGVTHQVLNARKHDEESQIIARAGAFGSVTIATNMAGRGVDIKLGGELSEEILAGVNRVLTKAGHDEPYDMTMDQRLAALRPVSLDDYGIYEAEIKAFFQYIDDMRRVRELGGLHVIGSERHEARRIDNQLRGRSARQGDPGSSRFFLSLEDDLMRLFGGAQVEGLLHRLNIDEAIPIESGMVGRLVEQSQTRVEGSNFDVRKHLLEYDDVLNSQRQRIYTQRDRVFTKQDLRDDLSEMLQAELQRRIPEALKDEEGPWKLLAYLEEIQPPLDFPGVVFPSYSIRLAISDLGEPRDAQALRNSLLNLAQKALGAEKDHLLRSAKILLEKTEETLNNQLAERYDTLDTFIESQNEKGDDEESPAPLRRPQEILDELSNLVRVPLRFSPEQLRLLVSNPKEIVEDVREQVRVAMTNLTVSRLIGTFERRLEESLGIKPADSQNMAWSQAVGKLMMAVEDALQRKEDRLLGDQGQIARDLDAEGQRLQAAIEDSNELVRMMELMAQGTRLTFDPKTHRRSMVVTVRLHYAYLAARFLEDRTPQWVTQDVLEHLQAAQESMVLVWGISDWNRLNADTLTLTNLDPGLDSFLQASIPAERVQAIQENLLSTISPEDQKCVRMALGWHLMNEIYRQLLLSVISELWVDYLTQVESLRVSIGLEAYAQRDPLVQYKGKASELFSKLLSDIRTGVIARMFVYRPRIAGSVQLERGKEEEAQHVPPANVKQEAIHAQAAPMGGVSPAAKQPVEMPRPTNLPAGDQHVSGSRKKRHRH